MGNSPYCFVVRVAHNHGNDRYVVKSIEEGSKYFAQYFEQLHEGEFCLESFTDIDDLGDIDDGFEESEKFSRMEYFLINCKVKVELLFVFVAFLHPGHKNRYVLGCFE